MHDPAHFGVNKAHVHTDPLTVRTKSLVLKTPPNLPECGLNSGKGLKISCKRTLVPYVWRSKAVLAQPLRPSNAREWRSQAARLRPVLCHRHTVAHRGAQNSDLNIDAQSAPCGQKGQLIRPLLRHEGEGTPLAALATFRFIRLCAHEV